MARRRRDTGFTLVEVMIALAIIGVTAVVLLQQRLAVVRDAARARDLRTAWVLSSQKIAELELDKNLWTGAGFQSNGDFGDVDPALSVFQWEYQVVPEPIDLGGPKNTQSDQKPRQLLRLTFATRCPGVDEPIVLEAEFPPYEAPPAAAPDDGKTPASGTAPASPAGTGTPAPAGGQK